MLSKTTFNAIDFLDTLNGVRCRLQAIREILVDQTLDGLSVDLADKQLVKFQWMLIVCSECLEKEEQEIESLRFLVQEVSTQSRACSVPTERRSELLTERV